MELLVGSCVGGSRADGINVGETDGTAVGSAVMGASVVGAGVLVLGAPETEGKPVVGAKVEGDSLGAKEGTHDGRTRGRKAGSWGESRWGYTWCHRGHVGWAHCGLWVSHKHPNTNDSLFKHDF